MRKEKSGKLINDRTEGFGINFFDTILLSIFFSANALVFLKNYPVAAVLVTGALYIFLAILRTSKRQGWVEEVVKYYVLQEFFGGVLYVKRNVENSRNKK